MTTDLAPAPARAPVTLFNGATPDDITTAARDVANRFSDIVKQQRLYKRIGERDHILIEAWQTIGTLTGVFATEAGGVRELPWPDVERMVWLDDEPPYPGPEPRDRNTDDWRTWRAADELRKTFDHQTMLLRSHTLGRAFGFSAAFRAVKDGREVGWGEGRVDRSERTWAGRDDYALASMAQTRGQSRALGAPLRFIVKLAGYEPTLPDDMPQEAAQGPTEPVLPWGPVTDKDEELKGAAESVKHITGLDGESFVIAMGDRFDGVPEACLIMLRGLAKFVARSQPIPTETEATE
jgi:hypothetical protein